MTVRVVLPHVCPSCRIQRQEWILETPKDFHQDLELRPGSMLPEAIADETICRDKCPDCRAAMMAFLDVDDDREAGGGVRILGVSEGSRRRGG